MVVVVVVLSCSFGTEKIEYKKYISMACKMSSDSNAMIRKAAGDALVGIYRIAGPEVREEMNRSDILPPSKLRTLNKKLRDSDLVLSTKSHLSRLQVMRASGSCVCSIFGGLLLVHLVLPTRCLSVRA